METVKYKCFYHKYFKMTCLLKMTILSTFEE